MIDLADLAPPARPLGRRLRSSRAGGPPACPERHQGLDRSSRRPRAAGRPPAGDVPEALAPADRGRAPGRPRRQQGSDEQGSSRRAVRQRQDDRLPPAAHLPEAVRRSRGELAVLVNSACSSHRAPHWGRRPGIRPTPGAEPRRTVARNHCITPRRTSDMRLGVDLGTTWTAAAVHTADGCEAVQLAEHTIAMPSVVASVIGDARRRRRRGAAHGDRSRGRCP